LFVKFDPRSQRFTVDDRFVGPASVLSTRWLLRTLEEARPYAGGRLLDIGCGSKPYKEFFGADEHIGIDWANSLHNLNAELLGSAEALPFADHTFDTVLCTEVIEHLKHPALAVSEMARVLKPDGHLILTAPFVHELHEMPHDFFRFTGFGLCSLVEEAGLKVILLKCRGGRLTVLADVLFRALQTHLRSVLRRVPMGKQLEGRVLRVLLVFPQRLQAKATFFWRDRVSKTETRAVDVLTRLTLGYVLVARRPSPEAG
jgi:SAM-dependent methyltransferase